MMTPGTKLGGRYRLDERIATGGMGDVWRATDEVLGREVAVKVLLPSLLNEPGFVERFRAEARVVATLTHPNIVRVYDYGESPLPGGGQIAYLVMEFVAGEALTAQLQRAGRLTVEQTMPIVAQAAEALHTAHTHGIIHRDVKPGNLMITPKGAVMLTDFGIARSALTGGMTAVGSVLGTAAYVSPEQANGQTATGQSDVYSLGIVAYQCLAGRRPFDSDNPIELAMRHINDAPPPLPDDVPEAARAFVATALAKDTAHRFASGEAMAAAARAVLGDTTGAVVAPGTSAVPAGTGPVPAPPADAGNGARGAAVPPPGTGLDSRTTVQPAVPPAGGTGSGPRRNRTLLVVAGVALLLVLIVGGAFAIFGPDDAADADGDRADDTGQSQSADPSDQAGDTVDVKLDDYLNRPPAQVKSELEELGFHVTIEGTGAFTVDVTPNGPVEPETSIVVKASNTRVPDEGDGTTRPGDGGSDPGNGGQSCTSPATIGCKP